MKKKKCKNKFKILLILIILICLIFIGFKSFNYYKNSNNNNSYNNKENGKDNEKPIIETPKEKIYKATIIGTGDGLAHTNVFNSALRDGDGKKYDFTYAFSKIKDMISSYDIAYYNQETIFGGESLGYSGYPRFNTPSSFGDYLIETGFNTVSLATNHTVDKGETGIRNALEYWKTKDIMYNGIAGSDEERENVTIKTVNNISYALLSYTTSTNGIPVPKGKSYLVNTYDKEKVKADIERIKNKVDVIIVAIHWGIEYSHNPNTFQKENAKYLSGLGVDIIFGTHPHVIQPIEKINDTYVYYSLGNFISNQQELPKRVGMFATLEVTKTVNEAGTSISINDTGTELTYVHIGANYRKHIVIPFSQLEDNYLSNYKTVYNKYKDILLSYDKTFIVKDL